MKHFITLSACVLILGPAMAQSSLPGYLNKTVKTDKVSRHVNQVLNRQMQMSDALSAAKTTVIKKRLLATSNYFMNGSTPELTDSARLRYTGVNGSKFNFENMYYDYYQPYGPSGGNFPYTYSKMDVHADSVHIWTNNGTVLELSEVLASTYTATKELSTYDDAYFSGGNPNGADKYLYTYDAQDRLTQLLGLTQNGSVWDSVFRLDFYYDAMGRLVRDTGFQYANPAWEPYLAESYTYDANGNNEEVNIYIYMAPLWIHAMQLQHTFYPNNKLKTLLYSETTFMPPFTLQPYSKDTIGYDAGYNFSTLRTQYLWNGSGWDPSFGFDKSLNTAGLPDTLFIRSWTGSAWNVDDKVAFAYNSDDLPVSGHDYIQNGSVYTLDNYMNFYYEEYNDATSVKQVKAGAEVVIYPNPASDLIHIKWDSNPEAVSVQILNASGQIVILDHYSGSQKQGSISVAHLAPGVYHFVMKGKSGETILSRSIVKQ